MAKIIHRHKYRAKKKQKKMTLKKAFQVHEQFCFRKNYGKCKKTQKNHTRNNRKKKKLFNVRAKLSWHKVFSLKMCWQQK